MARTQPVPTARSAQQTRTAGAGRRKRSTPDRLRTVLDNAPLVLFTVDRGGIVTMCEGSALAGISRGTAKAVVGRSVFEVFANVPQVQALVRGALKGKSQAAIIEVEGRYFDTRVSPMRDAEGAVTEIVAIGTDVTERRSSEAALLHHATHDALTDLANRSLFEHSLTGAIEEARSQRGVAAALLLDLVGFRSVNNCYGHAAGDEVLRQVAQRLRHVAPPPALVARFGADDFAVLLPASPRKDEASVVARRILEAMTEPFSVDGIDVSLMCGVGIAAFPRHAGNADLVLRHAEAALAVAKRSAAGVVVYSREDEVFDPRRLTLLGQLRQAISTGGLALHYQPKLSLRDDRVDTVEALVRWPHPVRGMLPPAEFIALAEETGVIRSLTTWAIAEAAAQVRRFEAAGEDVRIALNLSTHDLRDVMLPSAIDRLTTDLGMPRSSLEFEVTESAVMADPDRTMKTVRDLSEMGFTLCIDDFGTGYSSLSYLQRLPADEVKIDRTFVKDMVQDEYDRAIVRATIDLAHQLHMSVVAEGVEDDATRAMLADMGCDALQGYQVCRPLPADELIDWLRARPN